jgi:hypothetical protein
MEFVLFASGVKNGRILFRHQIVPIVYLYVGIGYQGRRVGKCHMLNVQGEKGANHLEHRGLIFVVLVGVARDLDRSSMMTRLTHSRLP